jgi:hypothetical protein
MPTVSLPTAPKPLTGLLLRRLECSPTDIAIPQLRQMTYARLLSTPSRLTSELLRTL